MSYDTSFAHVDLSAYQKLICLSEEKILFKENIKFPKILELPNSSDVAFLMSGRIRWNIWRVCRLFALRKGQKFLWQMYIRFRRNLMFLNVRK